MGLDTVELVMSLEEAFGVSISDQEWARATTVGEAADILVRELRKREGPGCRTMRVFHRVRRELKRAYGVERERVKLGTEIGTLGRPGGRGGNGRGSRPRTVWSSGNGSVGARAGSRTNR